MNADMADLFERNKPTFQVQVAGSVGVLGDGAGIDLKDVHVVVVPGNHYIVPKVVVQRPIWVPLHQRRSVSQVKNVMDVPAEQWRFTRIKSSFSRFFLCFPCSSSKAEMSLVCVTGHKSPLQKNPHKMVIHEYAASHVRLSHTQAEHDSSAGGCFVSVLSVEASAASSKRPAGRMCVRDNRCCHFTKTPWSLLFFCPCLSNTNTNLEHLCCVDKGAGTWEQYSAWLTRLQSSPVSTKPLITNTFFRDFEVNHCRGATEGKRKKEKRANQDQLQGNENQIVPLRNTHWNLKEKRKILKTVLKSKGRIIKLIKVLSIWKNEILNVKKYILKLKAILKMWKKIFKTFIQNKI